MLLTGLLVLIAFGQGLPAGDAGAGDTTGTAPAGPRMNAIGPVVGSPQWLGLCYERTISDHLSLGFHAGTMGVMSSFGARFLFGPTADGFRPRLGLGLALINALYQEDEDDPDGMAAYLWPTIGFNSRGAHFVIAVDAGWLFTGNRDAGLGQAGFPALSLSVLTRP